jgi:hypothetical protein
MYGQQGSAAGMMFVVRTNDPVPANLLFRPLLARRELPITSKPLKKTLINDFLIYFFSFLLDFSSCDIIKEVFKKAIAAGPGFELELKEAFF